MGKKKKKKSSEKKRSPAIGRCRRFFSFCGRVLRFGFQPRLLVPVALLSTIWILQPRFRQLSVDIASRPEYQLTPDRILVSDPPRWLPPDFVDGVLRDNRQLSDQSLSLLHDGIAELLTQAFEAHPWVRRVERIERVSGGKIHVRLEYRQPVAMVRVKQGYYPIDDFGVLLPPSDFTLSDTERFPLITNIRSVPHGGAGTFWGDPILPGAAQLARLLLTAEDGNPSYWQRFNLAAIRAPQRKLVSETGDDLVFEFMTRQGSCIIWGRPPGTDHPGELSSAQKLGRLENYLRSYGTFAGNGGPFEIDIRHWHEISRRSIARADDQNSLR